jgi:hypothetical protein
VDLLKALGLSAWAVAAAPDVKTHDLDVPRIGYVHSWTRTQDEGWVRAALDTFGVPYAYFADQKQGGQPPIEVRRHHLPARRRHRVVAGEQNSVIHQFTNPPNHQSTEIKGPRVYKIDW